MCVCVCAEQGISFPSKDSVVILRNCMVFPSFPTSGEICLKVFPWKRKERGRGPWW